MIRRNGTQTKPLITVLVVALVLSGLGVAHGQPNPQKEIERVVRDFLIAFGNRDYALFVLYFSEDATVFFPPPRSDRPPAPIAPQDLLIQEVDGHAVVTFVLGSETARQRRTLVLRRVGTEWKIVHLHGSASGNQP